MINNTTTDNVTITYPKDSKVCPSCGRCNECGRGGNDYWITPQYPSYPQYPQYPTNPTPYPFWYRPYTITS